MVGAQRAAQRLGALLLLLTWALAFLVIPGLHGVDHHNDHQHLGNGAVVPARAHAHPHPHAPQAPEAPESPAPTEAPGPLDHGAGLAHWGGALSSPKPLFLLPEPTLVAVPAAIVIAERETEAPHLRLERARGPPTPRLG